MRRILLVSIALGALSLVAFGCKGKESGPVKKGQPSGADTAGSGGSISLQGAGATFPYPLYSKWMFEYHELKPNVRIDYQSIGSGGGIRQILEETVDFGASDAPMKDEELAKAPRKLYHIPMTLGLVALVYNLEGVDSGLKLTSDAVAGIFLGEITRWNDPKIASANPDLKLPDADIHVAHRSDGSGTTAVFTGYLSAISPAWKEKVGAGKSVKFPTGLGAKGNEGVAGQIKTTPGTIGYVELAYAKQTKQTYAAVQNQAGKFLLPTPEGATEAAAGAADKMKPDDMRVSVVNAPGEKSYPISSFTYLLVYKDQKDAAKGKALADYLTWAIHDGQKYGPALQYAPLPDSVVKKDEAIIESLEAGGKPLAGGA